jgi:hypothetical protein
VPARADGTALIPAGEVVEDETDVREALVLLRQVRAG